MRERGKWEQRETRALRAKTDRRERQEKSTKLMSGRNLKKKSSRTREEDFEK